MATLHPKPATKYLTPSLDDAKPLSDQRFWYRVCLSCISGLLDHAGTYTSEEKKNHLEFVAQYVTSWLGHERHTAIDAPETPLQVASALETSLNFSTKGKPIVRFQFEPIAATVFARTAADPFGRIATLDMLEYTKQLANDVDLRWTEQLMEAFYPTLGQESATLLSKEKELPPPLDHAPMFNFAFDMESGKRKMKTYFLPIGKVMATGEPSELITFRAVRSLNPYGIQLAPAVQCLESYFAKSPQPLSIDLVGLDASDPQTARVKIYAHLQTDNSWKTVQDICTFGGLAMEKERIEGLQQLRSIWHLLLNEIKPLTDEESEKTVKISRDPHSFLGSLMFSFEIKPSEPFPLVKTYVPVWQYAPSDRKIADNLSSCFETLQWPNVAANYTQKLGDTYPGTDLSGGEPALLHSNVSFSYMNKTGAYMSIYYAVSARSVSKNTSTKTRI